MNYPPMPFIRLIQVVLNDIVVVGMLYGECLRILWEVLIVIITESDLMMDDNGQPVIFQ